jgi:hypothetical protein
MDYKIISVESRKGGVGKTTAALNISSLLLDMGYTVLLIDVDITGTNIRYALESAYWKDKKNIINFKEFDDNLLRLYKERFMIGKDLPLWQLDNNSNQKEDFVIHKDKINIIGSEVYDLKGNNRLICTPSILFDELHAYWFVEFLKSLCDSFAKQCGEDRTVIVFDNSPGYVGINPEIHEWLTDKGPINGKFLTISSLDKQDLITCSKAITDLHALFLNKLSGAKKYAEVKGKKVSNVKLNKEEQLFYQRLITCSNIDKLKEFYDSSKIDDESMKKLKLYQAIIINKVLTEIREDFVTYNLNKAIDTENDVKQNINVINELLETNSYNNKKYFVYYDENINIQFYHRFLRMNKEISKDRSLSYLKGHFTRLEKGVKLIQERYTEKLEKGKYENSIDIEDIDYTIKLFNNKIQSYENELDNLISSLRRYNLWNIIKLIDNDWYPQTPLKRIRQIYNEAWDRFGFYDYKLQEMEKKEILYKNIHELLEEFKYLNSLFSNLNENDIKDPKMRLRENVIILGLISTSFPYEFIKISGIEFLKNIISYQVERVNKIYIRSKRKRVSSYREFLIYEISSNEEDYFEMAKPFFKLDFSIKIQEDNFVEIYKTFCQVHLRYLDIDQDFEFLIRVLRVVTCDYNTISDILYPNIKDILDGVIKYKTIPHSRSDKELLKCFQSAKYMENFQKVLKAVLEDWNIRN